MMHQGLKVDAADGADDDWDTPPEAGPTLSSEDDQWLDLFASPKGAPPPEDADADDDSYEDEVEDSPGLTLEGMFSDHLSVATSFLHQSFQRTLSMSGNLNPTSFLEGTVQNTRARASSLLEGTVQQTRALSNTLIEVTVSRAMRLSSGAINVASNATTAALGAANEAARAVSPPSVEHINGRVKTLPDALAEKIAENSPDLQRLILRSIEYTSFACFLPGDACRCFAQNSTLRELYLYGWNVDDEGLGHIAACTSLTRLRVVENVATDAGAEALSRNSNLRELDISRGDWVLGNRAVIGLAGMQHLVNLRALTILDLNGHRIEDSGAQLLSHGLPCLRVLGLAQNGITDEGAAALGRLSALTHLDLSRNRIGSVGARALSLHSQLVVLNLAHNRIDNEAMRFLLQSTKLGSLNVSSNGITHEGLTYVAGAVGLASLDLSMNDMLAPALQLLEQHPSLTACELRLGHVDDSLDSSYWNALRRIEDKLSHNLQIVIERRRKLIFLFISLARQRATLLKRDYNVHTTMPFDLLMVILGFSRVSDYGKMPMQLQACCRWVFKHIDDINTRLKERRSLHVVEKTYQGLPESFHFGDESSSTCAVS